MHVKTQAIVLQAIKHHETSLLLKLFTHEKGLITCFVRNQKSKSRRVVKWQVLDVVDLDLVITEKNDIYGIKEATYAFSGTERYFDPYRMAMSYFTAEILVKVIAERNIGYPELFDFALEKVNEIEHQQNLALFPLSFLVSLSDILGVKPKVETGADVFNLSEGAIERVPRGLQSISTSEVPLLAFYLEKGYFEQQPGKAERARMLQLMLDFLKYHLPNFIEIKSLGVLKEVLN